MNHFDLLPTLAAALAAALALGYITHRLGLSPIVGYLLAGVVIGEHTPGFAANQDLAKQMAEIGVVLLMFGVGLHFDVRELLAVKSVAIPGAICQSLVATVLGAAVALSFGDPDAWDLTAGIVFGLAISVASTVVLVRVLSDNRDLHTPAGHVAVGWLVVEDLFTVGVLVLLPAIYGSASGEPLGEDLAYLEIVRAILLAIFRITILIGFVFLVGGRFVPWFLEQVSLTRSRELFTLSVLVLALGIAVGSAEIFKVSIELGAFLAGMVVGRSEFSLRAASDAMPMRDAFAVLFFVSIGMLLDPQSVIQSPMLVAATVAVIMIGKPFAAVAIVLVMRYPPRLAMAVGVALSQIGEFSFVLAKLAQDRELLPEQAMHALVAAAMISITLNPILYRTVDPLHAWLMRRPAFRRWFVDAAVMNDVADEGPRSERHRGVVIGYGPVGRTVSRILLENDIVPTIVEMNLETVRTLRQQRVDAVYGDASQRETLVMAGVPTAEFLILSTAGMRASAETIRLARELNPDVLVLARSAYVGEIDPLRHAGARYVFAGESEVALALATAILRDLGATNEQIERERDRVYEQLLGPQQIVPERNSRRRRDSSLDEHDSASTGDRVTTAAEAPASERATRDANEAIATDQATTDRASRQPAAGPDSSEGIERSTPRDSKTE